MTPEEEIAHLKQLLQDHLDAWSYTMASLRQRAASAEAVAKKARWQIMTAWNDAIDTALNNLRSTGRLIDREELEQILVALKKPAPGNTPPKRVLKAKPWKQQMEEKRRRQPRWQSTRAKE